MDLTTLHNIVCVICFLSLIYNYYSNTSEVIIRIPNPVFSALGPHNTTNIVVDDNYTQLIDIEDFTFKINPQPCKPYSAGLLLVVIISSNPNNFENRKIIRKTWGRNFDSTKVIFLLGEPDDVYIAHNVREESMKYDDIVLGDFTDAYRNMTYKHVMGLKWIVHHCPTAKYVLKTDDDVLVNSHYLRHFLKTELSPWGAINLISCTLLKNSAPQRSTFQKWMVTTEEYPGDSYPTYCAGWAILYSQDVIPRLLKAAQSTPYFWIDDVHVTGVCAKKIGIIHTPISKLVLSHSQVNILKMLGPKCVGSYLFGPQDLSVNSIKEIWTATYT